MARKQRMAIELLSDIGAKAYDLQAYTELEIQAALAVMRSVNAPLFDWLTRLLVAGRGSPTPFDFVAHLNRQAAFSQRTFGPGARSAAVVDHIRKELLEVEAEPSKLSEWMDVVILGLDGAWRAGHSSEQIAAAFVAKQERNEGQTWPDWRTADPNKAIEHVREGSPTKDEGPHG